MCENDPKFRTGRGRPNMTPEQMYDASDEFAHEAGSVTLGAAISKVVCSMSERTRIELLESIIGDQIANCGDTSTLEQFDRVKSQIPSNWPYIPDPIQVRAVLCATSAACGMQVGLGPDDSQIVKLASATLRGRTFGDIIH